MRTTGGGRAERSDPTQHAKGRTGDCPGPRKETATRRNVTRGVPPPPGPPPHLQTNVSIEGKRKLIVGKILSGHFWHPNLWVPDPPPFAPRPLSLPCGPAILHALWPRECGGPVVRPPSLSTVPASWGSLPLLYARRVGRRWGSLLIASAGPWATPVVQPRWSRERGRCGGAAQRSGVTGLSRIPQPLDPPTHPIQSHSSFLYCLRSRRLGPGRARRRPRSGFTDLTACMWPGAQGDPIKPRWN